MDTSKKLIKKINDFENACSADPLHLTMGKTDGFIEEKMEVNIYIYRWKQRSIKKYTELWDRIKNEIDPINGGKKF